MKKHFKILSLFAVVALCIGMLTACGLFGGSGGGGDNSGGDGNGSNNNTPSTVTVTLDPNEGTGVSQLTLTGYAGDPLSLPTPTREGYTFDKWYYNYTQIIDTTVFPNQDVKLTARYYATKDTERTIYFQGEQNKEFSLGAAFQVADGSFLFNDEEFLSSSYYPYSRFLQNNPDVDIKIGASVEIKSRATIKVSLRGANPKEIIKQEKVDATEYAPFTITATGKASLVHRTTEYYNAIIRLRFESTLGSTSIYYRNPTAYITYTEKAGMLV